MSATAAARDGAGPGHRASGPAWRRALAAAAVLRAGVALVTVVAPRIRPLDAAVPVLPQEGFGGWAAAPAEGLGLVGAGLERFDALWYLAIAADGYPTTELPPQAVAFFPGFPALVAAAGAALGGRLLLAASVVAFLATVAALAGVHELAHDAALRRHGTSRAGADADGLARRALWLLASFPTAFFLVAPYPTSTFLAVTAWALVLAGRGRWVAAALLGLAAGTLRPLGAALALPVLLLALRQGAGAGAVARRPGATAAAVTAPVVGLVAVATAAALRYGAPLAVLQVQAAWQRAPAWPWTTLLDAGRSALAYGSWWALDAVVVLPVMLAVVWLLVRDRVLGPYALAHAMLWLAAPFDGRPLLSAPRFALGVAPLALALAAWTSRRSVLAAVLVAQSGLLVLHLVLFSTWGLVF